MGDYDSPTSSDYPEYPSSTCPSLILTHSTSYEKVATWNLNSSSWGTALSKSDYLEREAYLCTVPLARNNGVSHWILVPSHLPSNERPIYASCETLCKPVVVCTAGGEVKKGITHGIGSVFSNPKYRGRGYAARMLRELGEVLKTHQIDSSVPGRETVPFSILYSDIGMKFYAKLGWDVYPATHISFPVPSSSSSPLPPTSAAKIQLLTSADLPALCELDTTMVQNQLKSNSAKDNKTHIALLPNADTMSWHHSRETFVTKKLFPSKPPPTIRGALAGSPGNRVWAIFTRAYYGPLSAPSSESGNTFHILRLVMENETITSENVESLRGILEIAKAEAKEWELGNVDVWNPSQVVKGMVERIGVEYQVVDRKEESLPSLMWYGGDREGRGLVWDANEKFGWC